MQPLRKSLPFVFAVAAFLACVLACRPGFSPDGNRILFPVYDEDSRTTSVCIYDRKTEKITALRTLGWSAESNVIYCATSWSPSGAQLGLVLAPQKDSTNGSIEIIDAQSGHPIRSAALTNGSEGLLLYPPVFAKDFLFFGGESPARFNLRNGKTDYENMGTNHNREFYILNNQNGVHYYAEWKQDDSNTNKVTANEFGTIDVDRFTRVPEQVIPTEMVGLPDFSPDGKRVALWKKPRSAALEIWSHSKLEKTIALPNMDSLVMGNIVWSKDQKTIFAPAFREPKESSDIKALLSVFEIPLDGSAPRQLELGAVKIKPDEAMLACQLAMAPDGKALAVGTPFGSLDSASKPASLYLIDLTNPKRTVKPILFHGKTVK
ncbi:MAG: hypothetical protein JWM68_2534 [Verrucomicrobiales bacterium]|nr:hypothetical protein [Verrucomicrobiales bacterium]